jgi:hypothetical protein
MIKKAKDYSLRILRFGGMISLGLKHDQNGAFLRD